MNRTASRDSNEGYESGVWTEVMEMLRQVAELSLIFEDLVVS